MVVCGIAFWLVPAVFLIKNTKEENRLLVEMNLLPQLVQTACRKREKDREREKKREMDRKKSMTKFMISLFQCSSNCTFVPWSKTILYMQKERKHSQTGA